MASLPGHLGLLSKACQELFRPHVAAGAVGPADLDPKIVTDLDAMPEASALICCERFLSSNVFGIRPRAARDFRPRAFCRRAIRIGPKAHTPRDDWAQRRASGY